MSKDLSVRYYEKNRKGFKKGRAMYHDLFEKEKKKKEQYGRKKYKNLSED